MRGRREDIHGTVRLGQVAVGHHVWRLVADAKLEARRAPVNDLDCALRLECRNSGMRIVGYDITAVQQARGHVLAAAWIALHHLVVRFEA